MSTTFAMQSIEREQVTAWLARQLHWERTLRDLRRQEREAVRRSAASRRAA
ncbi:MAG TPA: hypothetical protein VHP57_00270 [Acidimicrobiia bacterium]|jgi:hypothetical protein|nr:hypothetical protein [Acidimicrobiia bacterium]